MSGLYKFSTEYKKKILTNEGKRYKLHFVKSI